MNDGMPPTEPGKFPCASKYGTACPLFASLGYQACAITCRWSDGFAVSVSGR
jgi:hypothetical protein